MGQSTMSDSRAASPALLVEGFQLLWL